MTTLPQPSGVYSQEEFLDMLAYALATDERTSGIQWILGEAGMGAPIAVPFAYISALNETTQWYTANGRPGAGGGGIAAGVDDWLIPVGITVAITPHQYVPPTQAVPPVGSPLSAAALGSPPPYLEQPGFRAATVAIENVKAVLRTNITVGGEVATTRVTDSRYLLVSIQGKPFRCARITLTAQQRRKRGV